MDTEELKRFIIDLIDEEFGPKPTPIGARWQGGTMVLKPSNDTQAKEIPLEVFFKKLMSVRDSLRVLEQKINSSSISAEDKLAFHSYITKAYGSLTTFNILFRDDKDKFVGSGGGGGGGKKDADPQMTMREAREKLGLKEYGRS